MSLRSPSPLLRYSSAVVAITLATCFRMLLAPQMGSGLPFITYFPAVMFVAWYGRLGPTLLATMLGALAAVYFFIPPEDTLAITNAGEFLGLAIFVLVGIVNAMFSEAWHRAARCAAENAIALEESRKALSTTLMSIGDAVIATDADGRVTFINPVAQSLTGYNQSEAAGRPIKEIFRIVNEQTRNEVGNPVEKVLREGSIVGLANHTVLISKDGIETPIDDSGALIRDDGGNVTGVVLVFRDITDRKQAQEALRESEERYRIVVETASDGIITIDEESTILFANRAAQKIFGYSVEEMHGQSLTMLMPEYLRQIHKAGVRRYIETGQKHISWEAVELVGLHKDGKEISLELSFGEFIREGKHIFTGIVRDITERRRAEAERARLVEQIEEQRQRLNNVVANVPGVVWEAWGQPDEAEQRIDFVSDYIERMLGYSVDEWLATPNFWLKIVHADDRERAANEAYAIFSSGKGGTSRFRWITKDDRALWVEAQSMVICDKEGKPVGMRGVTMDITERKQAEESERFLAETSKLLSGSLDYETTLASVARLMIPHLADWCVVHIVEAEGEVRQLAISHVDEAKLEWARQLQERYPYYPDAPTGVANVLRTGESEFYPEISDAMIEAVARDDEHLKIMREVGMKSGMVVPLVARGRTLGAMTLVMAESARRYDKADLALAEDVANRAALAVDNARLYSKAQQALAEREEALRLRDEFLKREQAAREEAEAANRAKDEFLATVSHELRTPLNAILGWSHMLQHNQFDEETRGRALETIERNAKSQTQLIEDILDVSRIITGKLRLDVQPVELAQVIEAAIDAVRPAADAREIRLQSVLDPRAGPVSGDPNRLQQIVWNLVSNAVKFTSRGGRVQVRLERVNSHVEIIVSDTGEGISPQFLPHVFDRFRQADATSTRRHGGLGLGLAIVRHLVEMHGGTVEAESSGEGLGASFTVKLPLIVAHVERYDSNRSHPVAGRSISVHEVPKLDGITVMVVDDERDARELLETMLRQFGAEVITCASSARAIEQLIKHEPDVIVSDIEMPDEDGYEFIRKVREMETNGHTPAVALTAYARTEDRLRALSAGYQMHVAKPVEPAELALVISSLAKRGGKSRLI